MSFTLKYSFSSICVSMLDVSLDDGRFDIVLMLESLPDFYW